MLAVSRFEVSTERRRSFARQLDEVADALRLAGALTVEHGANLDDPALWALVSTWADVGAYRRALGTPDLRMALGPVLDCMLDEPSAYDARDDRAHDPLAEGR